MTLEYDKNRIAILPFVNISANPGDEYFSDGLTEELISTLSKIGGLSVIARTSIMAYKGKEKRIDEIARDLKVGTLLEGSVRKAGDRIRVTVQLIDSLTSGHLWTESYDRELKDVFAIWGEISKTVADALKIQLLKIENDRIERAPTKNVAAHEAYLKGMHYYKNERLTEEGLGKAVEYFQRAVELDPEFALAHAMLSLCYIDQGGWDWISVDEAISKAEEEVERAFELDSRLPEAHLAMAGIMDTELDFKGSEVELHRALDLDPNIPGGRDFYVGILIRLGRLDEAEVEARKVLELDPISPFANHNLAWVYFNKKQYDRAVELLKKVREFNPWFFDARLAWCYLQQGKFAEAEAKFQKVVTSAGEKPGWQPGTVGVAIARAKSDRKEEARKLLEDAKRVANSKEVLIPGVTLPMLYTALGETEEALQLLETAYENREYNTLRELRGWWYSPVFDDLLSNPRFVALLKKIGFPLDSSNNDLATASEKPSKRPEASTGPSAKLKEAKSSQAAMIQLALETQKVIRDGESFALKLDLINTSMEDVFLHKIEGLQLEGSNLEDKQRKLTINEGGTLQLRGKKVSSFAMESLTFSCQIGVRKHADTIEFDPKVYYSDQDGTLFSKTLSSPHLFTFSPEAFQFQTERARSVFEFLTLAFIEDYMANKLELDKSGWRNLTDIAKGGGIPLRSVYGKTKGELSPEVRELQQRGVIETRFFPGERGRGGEVMRLRIDYSRVPIKGYVDGRIRKRIE